MFKSLDTKTLTQAVFIHFNLRTKNTLRYFSFIISIRYTVQKFDKLHVIFIFV